MSNTNLRCSRNIWHNSLEINKKINEKIIISGQCSSFEHEHNGFCEILEGCSSFRTRKKSCNSTLEIVNFMCSSGLGYYIKGVAGRKATG